MDWIESYQEATAAAQTALASSRDILTQAQNIQESEDKDEVDQALNHAQQVEDDPVADDSEPSKRHPQQQQVESSRVEQRQRIGGDRRV